MAVPKEGEKKKEERYGSGAHWLEEVVKGAAPDKRETLSDGCVTRPPLSEVGWWATFLGALKMIMSPTSITASDPKNEE